MVKFSIIMPVYNTGEILHIAVDAIIGQTYTDWELLLIDDGSTDTSPSMCDEYAQKDSRIKVFHKPNGGICDARNYGLKKASGEYIAFSDHDDEYSSDLLEVVAKAISGTHIDIVKYRYKSILDNGVINVLPAYKQEPYSTTNISNDILPLISKDYLGTIWSFIYRADLLHKNNLFFDTKYKHGGEDFNYNAVVFNYVDSIVVLPNVLYTHYVRGSLSTSAKRHYDSFLQDNDYVKSVNNLVQAQNIDVDNYADEYASFLSWCTMRVVSRGIQVNAKYQEIVAAMKELNGINLLKVKACPLSLKNRIVYVCLKQKIYTMIYLLAYLKLKIIGTEYR